jgi:hypothetical protein
MRRLKCDFRSENGAKFELLIYDRDYSGDPVSFEIAAESAVIKHEGDADDPFKHIVPTHLSFNMLLNCDIYTEGQITELGTFYNDLVTSYEGRFFVSVRQLPFTDAYIFRGKIIADVGDVTMNYWRDLKITAICGLTDLKNKQFRPTTYSDLVAEDAIRTYSFLEMYVDIMKRNDVVKFFYADLTSPHTGPMMSTSFNWFSVIGGFGDTMATTRMRNHYFEQISPSYRKYESCWDVLKDMLTGFNARLFFSTGVYQIEQLAYQNNPTVVRYYYTYAGTSTTGTSNKILRTIESSTSTLVLADPSIKVLPAFKAVELKQSKSFTNYMNGMSISVNGNNGPHDFGPIITVGNRLIFQWKAEILLGPAWSAVAWTAQTLVEWELSFKCNIGDYWLKVPDIYTNEIMTISPGVLFHVSNQSIPELEWTLVESTVTLKWSRVIVSANLADFNNQVTSFRTAIRQTDLTIQSLEIQDEGELTLLFLDFETRRNGAVIAGFPPGSIHLDKRSRIIVASSYTDLYEPPDDFILYEVNDIRNTLIYQISLKFFDSEKNELRQLFVGEDEATQLPSTEWVGDDLDETLPLQLLVVSSLLAMRQKPSKLINCVMYQKSSIILLYFDVRYSWNSQLWIPIRQEHNLTSDTYAMTLYNPYRDGADIYRVATGDPYVDFFPLPGGIDASQNVVNYAGEGIHFTWIIPAAPDPYVTVDYDMSIIFESRTLEQIMKQNDVYHNGVKQRYIDWETLTFPPAVGELLPGQYTIVPDLDEIHFSFLEEGDFIEYKWTNI